MKTSNKSDNRFTKDILLRQIFQEISDENKKSSVDDLIPDPNETSPRSAGLLKWIFIVIFLIGVISLWFYTLTEVTQSTETPAKNESYPAPKTDQTVQKKEESHLPELLKETSKKSHPIEKTDSIQLIVEAPRETEDPKTEREKAKEALLLQMQN